jgi:O-acetyl-ADP-ribose deacetylase (regulator of RNase III)
MEVVQSDITRLAVDAIVNAANSSLLGGGGVDGAIHRAGGPQILEECRAIVARQGGCRTGNAVITSGGNLPARRVIHTVGPVWNGGNNGEAEKLAACYASSLNLAVENDIRSIAFPAISTGIYGFPKDRAVRIAVRTVAGFLEDAPTIERVIFVAFDAESKRLLEDALQEMKD